MTSLVLAAKPRSNCLADAKEISIVATAEAVLSEVESNAAPREKTLSPNSGERLCLPGDRPVESGTVAAHAAVFIVYCTCSLLANCC